jgi:ketosteroid isomerase-like protein
MTRGLSSLTLACWMIALSTPSAATGAEGPIATSAKQQVLELGKQWAAAENKHDSTTLNRILDDKFVAFFGTGKRMDKAAYIKEMVGGDVDPTASQVLADETVVIDGDTAVVFGTDTVHGTENGAVYTQILRYTVTYIRRHSRWLALAEHLVKAPAAATGQ